MTSEVLIMNRQGIALASDSAATMGSNKIINTADKLFNLSKYQPVAIMINGNAMLNNVSWEIIIKDFRRELGKKSYKTLFEYAEKFFEHIDNNMKIFPKENQEKQIRHICNRFYGNIIWKISLSDIEYANNASGKKTRKKQKHLDSQISKIIEDNKYDIKDFPKLRMIEESEYNAIKNEIVKIAEEEIDKVFKYIKISEKQKELLINFPIIYFLHYDPNERIRANSGIVIAGFGTDDYFPCAIYYNVYNFIQNRVLCEEIRRMIISEENRAEIVPIAQSEMIDTFIKGIHPYISEKICDYLDERYEYLPEEILKIVEIKDPDKKQEVTSKLKDLFNDLIYEYIDLLEDITNENISEIKFTIEGFPVNEIATMAETLINFMSFRRKFSSDRETVGGPIDVAVISKGDGFIWIKRKQYFKPELNPHFMKKYYMDI